jgi:tape measure domain-containing protein
MKDFYEDQVKIAKGANEDFLIVERALNKKILADTEAKTQREIDLAKIKHKRESQFTKQIVSQITDKNNTVLQQMKDFYKEEEKLAKKSYDNKNTRLSAIERRVNAITRTAYFQDLEQMSPTKHKAAMKNIREAAMSGDLEAVKDAAAGAQREVRNLRRQMVGLQAVQNGLADSTRNMLRSYISLFALFEATTAIKNVGMQFESMRAGMLVAAKDQEDVGKKLSWVDEQATRLGLNLAETSKAFVKLSAASKGKIGEEDLEEMFLGIAEAGTVMQLSMDDVNGSLRAVQQMIQKNQVYAEEFRSQLNERMPLAMQAMENATGKTAKELSKMMEMGQLGIDVLPAFGRELRRLANQGGALEKTLESVRVTEARLITQSQKSGDKIFKSGFGEGLSQLYTTMTQILKDAGPQLQKIGKIFGTIFKGIAHVLKLIEPPLKAIINNIEMLGGAYLLGKLAALRAALFTTFLPITAALATAEELISLFSDKLVGVTEKKLGFQINLADRTTTDLVERDGKIFSQSKTKESFLPDVKAFFGEDLYNLANFLQKYNPTELMSHITGGDTSSPAMQTPAQNVINQTNTIKVEGVSGEDVARQVGQHLTQFTLNTGR